MPISLVSPTGLLGSPSRPSPYPISIGGQCRMNRPGLTIAIIPHAGGEPDEDSLDREQSDFADDPHHSARGHRDVPPHLIPGGPSGFGNTSADKRIDNLISALERQGPAAARKIKLYSDALAHLVAAYNHRDAEAFHEAREAAIDGLHELIELTRGGNSK